jgi:hypothetical protein
MGGDTRQQSRQQTKDASPAFPEPNFLCSAWNKGSSKWKPMAPAALRKSLGFLQKPFDANRLSEAVASALGLEAEG